MFITLKLLDTVTGDFRILREEPLSCWTDGNTSCDCNRAKYFEENPNWLSMKNPPCLGCQRYLVVATNIGINLETVNLDYPVELLKAYGLIHAHTCC